jgi:hypothetical protein
MNRFFLSIFFFLATYLPSIAQSPTLDINPPQELCVNTPLKVRSYVTGLFNAENVFKVRIRENNQSEIIELPATFADDLFELTIPANRVALGKSYEMQVTSSAPAMVSKWSNSFTMHSKGELTIPDPTADTVNQYRDFAFVIRGKSSSSGIVTLSDGSGYSLNSGSYNSEMATSLIAHRYPEASTVYTIASASNVCGPMTVSGQAKVHVNPVSIGTTMITPQTPCLGSEIRLSFKVDAGTLPDNAQYKIRLVQAGSYPELISPDRYEFPAVLKDGQLVATIPDNIPLTKPTYFKAAVLIPSAGVVGAFEEVTFSIYPKPYAEIISQSETVNPGDGFGIGVRYRGPNPYIIHLSDGSKIYDTEQVIDSRLGDVRVYPQKTTDYFIKSIETICAAGPISTKRVTATVIPGIAIALPDTVTRYCEGAKVRFPFTTNATISASTVYSVKLGFWSDTLTVPAVRIGQEIEFTVPLFKERLPNPMHREGMFSMQLVAQNPGIVSNQIGKLTILGKPEAYWPVNPLTIIKPGFSVQDFSVLGGGPFALPGEASPTGSYLGYNESASIGIFASQSGEYGYNSISNSCFVNNNPVKLRINITNPAAVTPDLAPIATRQRICEGDSAEVDIRVVGNFAPGNEFRIMASGSECCNYQTVRTVIQGGRVRIFLPYDHDRAYLGRTTYYLKVASTNPEIISRSFEVSVDQPAKNFSVQYPTRMHLMDIIPQVTIKHDGGPIYGFTYSDDEVDYSIQTVLQTGYPSFNVKVKTGENPFQIKSITSACGKQEVNLPFNMLVNSYRISFPVEFQHTFFCTGSTMTVPFSILNGEAPGARFFLQLSKDYQSFTTVSEVTDRRYFEFKIPVGQPIGAYRLRVMSSDSVGSGPIEFSIGSQPSAIVTVQDQQGSGPYEFRAGQTVYANIQLQGSLPQWISTSSNATFEGRNSQVFTSFEAKKGGTFAIKSLTNACGPGTSEGSFSYQVKPGLMAYLNPEPHCREQELIVNYNLQGDVDLSDDYIRFSLIHTLTQQAILLDSTRALSGSLRLNLPGDLALGYYNVRVFVRKYGLSETPIFELLDRPVVSLRSNTTINPGGKTNLIVRSENGENGQDVKFILSNGYTGFFAPRLREDAVATVSPTVTTIFQIASVSNVCGTGTITGASATVTVNQPSSKTIDIIGWTSTQGHNSFCVGDEISVEFDTTGTFSAGNKFQVQISDSTGRNFQNIPTLGDSSPLIATLPTNLLRTIGYRLRVVASDTGVASADFAAAFVTRAKPTIQFMTDYVDFDGKTVPKAGILLTGDVPITTMYRNATANFQKLSMVSPDSLLLYAPVNGQVYTITRVSNECGDGTIGSPSSVTIGLITAVQNEQPLRGIAFPNPTRDLITIKLGKSGAYKLRLYDLSGRLLDSFSINKNELMLDLRNYPAGTLLLNVESGQTKSTFRILRE